jgi:Ca2+-transporting ATPase
MGRRIFDNLKKAIAYIFAVHVPIAGMALLPVLLKLPIALLPAHIAFLELIIDPACSTVFEACREENDIMNRPPRRLTESLFNKKAFLYSLLQGLSVLVVVLAVFIFALHFNKDETQARSLAFTTLVFANIMLIITNLSWSESFIQILSAKNKALWLMVIAVLAAILLIIYLPFLRKLFHFSVLSPEDLLIAFFSAVASLIWFEGIKQLNKIKPVLF